VGRPVGRPVSRLVSRLVDRPVAVAGRESTRPPEVVPELGSVRAITPDLSHLPGLLRDTLGGYEQPARGTGGRALGVVRPATVEQVRDVVRWAVSERVRLVPQGANTGLVGSSVPDASGSALVLSTERLIAPIEIDVTERTCTVLAGVRLSALNAAAARFGLHLPIDLSADPALGGMISTNTGGSRVLRYGPLRHHVLAIEAIAATPSADIIGGPHVLRKDARGVDLSHC
jgi:FAD/FMN-containing dehydrogenase